MGDSREERERVGESGEERERVGDSREERGESEGEWGLLFQRLLIILCLLYLLYLAGYWRWLPQVYNHHNLMHSEYCQPRLHSSEPYILAPFV